MRLVRLVRFIAAMLRAAWRTSRAAARAPEAERAGVQARGQQEGAAACLRALGIRVRVDGALPERAGLLAPNHLGLLDGFVLAATFPCAVAGKSDVAGWPLIGYVATSMGYVAIHRERKTATDAFVDAVRARIADGVSVLVFPEGTTSDGEGVLPFKTGAFEAVAGSGLPVFPVYHRPLEGRRGLVPTKAFSWVREPLVKSLWRALGHLPADYAVVVGAPVSTEAATRKTLAVDAFAAVEAMRARTAGTVELVALGDGDADAPAVTPGGARTRAGA